MSTAFSALTLVAGHLQGIRPVKIHFSNL